MLTRLSISNLATIESLSLELGPGFSVFTGETGAGKSILIDAIRLVLGARAATDLMRTGATQTVVEAVFDLTGLAALRERLEELGIPDGGELVLRRVVQDNGRSRALANDCTIAVGSLAALARHLVSVHGQHDNQTLLQADSHIGFLDTFGDLLSLREEVGRLHRQYSALLRDHRALEDKLAQREQRMAELDAVIEDIRDAALQPGEDEALRAEVAQLTHAEKLIHTAEQVDEALYEGEGAVLARLQQVEQWLAQAGGWDPGLHEVAGQVAPLRFQVEDLHQAMADYRARLEADPHRLEHLNERLAQIEKVQRRHGGTTAAVLEHLARCEGERADLEEAAGNREHLEARMGEVAERLHRTARDLSARRREVAAELDRAVKQQLDELGMDKASFETRVSPHGGGPARKPGITPSGADDVEFLLSPNPGQALRPLVRIASGGELSRIMLALQTVLTRADPTGTLIFDEVDAGISGGMAEIVGRKLRALGTGHQVLCITHLPQIAALAAHHVLVSKEMDRQQTYTRAQPLDGDSKVREVARLLSGIEVTDRSLRSAEELVQRGR